MGVLMNSIKLKNHSLLVLLILLAIPKVNVLADKHLEIGPIQQDKTNWCWAACCEMISDAYKMTRYGNYGSFNQYEVATWAVNGNNSTNFLFGYPKSVDKVLEHFGPIFSNPTPYNPATGGGNLTKYDIALEINQGRPFIAGWERTDAPDHCVLVNGYTGSGIGSDVVKVKYLDPFYGDERSYTYAEFVQQGDFQKWKETLRFTTNPREPIPTGIGTAHVVLLQEYDCTEEITQSPQSLTFRAIKWGDTPVSWEWKLVFPHINGDAIVASWNTSTSQDDLTWNITNFTMPSNYDWIYQNDGRVAGRIEVICMDPDYHFDAINIIYVPGDIYPGILVYKDQVVNNNKPDVRAHQILIAENDNFMPGGNISLKSGGRIDIKDGITIGNGSQVDFIIDPSLR